MRQQLPVIFAKTKEITDVTALEIASESYRENNGVCPESADVLAGDCKFESSSVASGDL